MNDISWSCHICEKVRPDDKISVVKTDLSKKYGLPKGSMTQNVRHCNDNEKCIKESTFFEFSTGG